MIKFKDRNRIITGIILLIAIIFLSKLFYIQVVNDNYKFSANNNVLRYDVQQPVRGLIYDRYNKLIVANVPAYDLMIVPRELKGKKIDIAEEIFSDFTNLVSGTSEDLKVLNEEDSLYALKGVGGFPMRVKCATMAWHAFKSALKS